MIVWTYRKDRGQTRRYLVGGKFAAINHPINDGCLAANFMAQPVGIHRSARSVDAACVLPIVGEYALTQVKTSDIDQATA